MFCIKYGKKVKEFFEYCPYCGTLTIKNDKEIIVKKEKTPNKNQLA